MMEYAMSEQPSRGSIITPMSPNQPPENMKFRKSKLVRFHAEALQLAIEIAAYEADHSWAFHPRWIAAN
jgi:hypothetical protein